MQNKMQVLRVKFAVGKCYKLKFQLKIKINGTCQQRPRQGKAIYLLPQLSHERPTTLGLSGGSAEPLTVLLGFEL